MKKWYRIKICGDSEGYCYRELDIETYMFLHDIFEETTSEYAGGFIDEVEKKYIIRVCEELNIKCIKQNNDVHFIGLYFVNSKDKIITFPTYQNLKQYHYFFDTYEEAISFGENKAKELNCKFTNYFTSKDKCVCL